MSEAASGLPSLDPGSHVRPARGFAAWAFAAVVIVAVLVIGWPQLSRPGYSPDEEFTVFAVRGIEATRLPLLPSNLVYDRGLAYSYASWVAGSVVGGGLAAYRAVALLSAIAALVLIYRVVSRFGSTTAAVIATALVATSLTFWATAATARFYGPFLALYLATLFRLSTLGTHPLAPLAPGTLGTFGALTLLAFASRLTHELAFTIAAIPLLCLLVSARGGRVRWLWPSVVVFTGLAAAQAVLFALHYLAPASGETMVRRFFLWQVLNLFEVPPDRQFGIAFVVLAIAWLIAPRRARLNVVIALCVVAFIFSLSLSRALAIAPFSWSLVQSVLTEGSRYPLDMFWHIARTTPVTVALAMGLLFARLAGAGGDWRPIDRAAHLLWIGWVVWFGVIESGMTINYLLLPVSLMLIAIAVDLSAIVAHNIDGTRRAGSMVSWAVCALAIAAVVGDQWRGTGGSFDARLEQVRPTLNVAGIDEIRDSLQPGDRIACTDELGCLMLVGRIDAWLALDDYLRERFVVKKADGQLAGVYTGKPAVFRPAELFDGPPADRTLIVDVFKDLPVDSTRDWLPRALQRDGLDARILLETPQARVVEISPLLQHAGHR